MAATDPYPRFNVNEPLTDLDLKILSRPITVIQAPRPTRDGFFVFISTPPTRDATQAQTFDFQQSLASANTYGRMLVLIATSEMHAKLKSRISIGPVETANLMQMPQCPFTDIPFVPFENSWVAPQKVPVTWAVRMCPYKDFVDTPANQSKYCGFFVVTVDDRVRPNVIIDSLTRFLKADEPSSLLGLFPSTLEVRGRFATAKQLAELRLCLPLSHHNGCAPGSGMALHITPATVDRADVKSCNVLVRKDAERQGPIPKETAARTPAPVPVLASVPVPVSAPVAAHVPQSPEKNQTKKRKESDTPVVDDQQTAPADQPVAKKPRLRRATTGDKTDADMPAPAPVSGTSETVAAKAPVSEPVATQASVPASVPTPTPVRARAKEAEKQHVVQSPVRAKDTDTQATLPPAGASRQVEDRDYIRAIKEGTLYHNKIWADATKNYFFGQDRRDTSNVITLAQVAQKDLEEQQERFVQTLLAHQAEFAALCGKTPREVLQLQVQALLNVTCKMPQDPLNAQQRTKFIRQMLEHQSVAPDAEPRVAAVQAPAAVRARTTSTTTTSTSTSRT